MRQVEALSSVVLLHAENGRVPREQPLAKGVKNEAHLLVQLAVVKLPTQVSDGRVAMKSGHT